jgi:hypothetical protein
LGESAERSHEAVLFEEYDEVQAATDSFPNRELPLIALTGASEYQSSRSSAVLVARSRHDLEVVASVFAVFLPEGRHCQNEPTAPSSHALCLAFRVRLEHACLAIGNRSDLCSRRPSLEVWLPTTLTDGVATYTGLT